MVRESISIAAFPNREDDEGDEAVVWGFELVDVDGFVVVVGLSVDVGVFGVAVGFSCGGCWCDEETAAADVAAAAFFFAAKRDFVKESERVRCCWGCC